MRARSAGVNAAAAALVAALVLAAVVQRPCATGEGISYQIHSYDDLRLWPQAFAKGATWAKVDPHYMNASFCASQPRAPADARGCFVLSHNTPDAARVYNTTSDLLALLVAPSLAPVFSSPTRRVTIALCFKLDAAVPCDGSAASGNFISLVSSLVNDTAALLAAWPALNVQFVLDGDASPSDVSPCLNDLWTGLPATWTGVPPQPIGAAFSNDSAGYARFDIFDMPVPEPGFNVMAKLGWGKFGAAPWPLLVWEPSNQSQIVEVADTYLAVMPAHPSGLRFAINIDPVQFEIYAASASRTAWNTPVGPWSSSASAPLGVVVPPATTVATEMERQDEQAESALGWLVFDACSYALCAASEPLVGVPACEPASRLADDDCPFGAGNGGSDSSTVGGSASAFSSTDGARVQTNVLVSSASGAFTLFSLGEAGDRLLVPLVNGTAPLAGAGALSATALVGTDIFLAASAPVGSTPVGCAVELSVVFAAAVGAGRGAGAAHGDDAAVRVTCVALETGEWSGALPATVALSVGALASADASSQAAVSSVCPPGLRSAVALVAIELADSTLAAAMVCVNVSGGAGGAAALGPLVAFDVGAVPRFALAAGGTSDGSSGGGLALETHGEGYCWNTENNNKQAVPATCDNVPESTPYVLNYNLGSLGSWAAMLSAGPGLITPCTGGGILHGTYDTGSWPFPMLAALAPPVVGVIELHVSLPVGAVDVSGCGLAVPFANATLIVDAWPLPVVA